MSEIILTAQAQLEFDEHFDWWALNHSHEQASRWYRGFLTAMLKLESNARRHPLAAETDFVPYELRQLNYGLGRRPTHRALYAIRDDKIVILRVRHLAQDSLEGDL